MRMYDAEILRALRRACAERDVLLVADEVFTGYGRTGPMWASSHAGVAPDVMCLGKSFCPILPMAAVLASDRVFSAFGGARDRAFLYGHTFAGNPLGAAVALEVLRVYEDENVLSDVARKSPQISAVFSRLGGRAIGMVGAVDLAGGGYLGGAGWRVYDEARKRGAYLRPLGDTVYVAPPLTISDADLAELLGIVEECVRIL